MAENNERDERDRLVRIETKLAAVFDTLNEMKEQLRSAAVDSVRLALAEQMISDLRQEIRAIREEAEKKFVTQAEFEPIRRVFWIIAGIIITGIIGAILTLVIV